MGVDLRTQYQPPPPPPVVLRDPDPPTVEPSWNPLEFADSLENYVIENLGTPFRLHTQDALLEAMREQHPWAP